MSDATRGEQRLRPLEVRRVRRRQHHRPRPLVEVLERALEQRHADRVRGLATDDARQPLLADAFGIPACICTI